MGHRFGTRRARCGASRVAGSRRGKNFQPTRCEEGEQSGNLIHVKIAGLRNNRGQVYCYLFQSAAGFPSNTEGNAASTASTITNRRAACDFENQDPGSYAILVFHDEDSTHVLELNPNGTPREGVGLSNNPQGSLRTTRLRRGEVSLPNRQAESDDQRELSLKTARAKGRNLRANRILVLSS